MGPLPSSAGMPCHISAQLTNGLTLEAPQFSNASGQYDIGVNFSGCSRNRASGSNGMERISYDRMGSDVSALSIPAMISYW